MIDNNCNVQLIKALFSLVVLVLDFVVCFGGLVLSEGLLFVVFFVVVFLIYFGVFVVFVGFVWFVCLLSCFSLRSSVYP